MQTPSQSRRADWVVLALMIAGLLLNIFAPIWLRPPLFAQTALVYLLLFFAWVPAYLLLRRGRRLRKVLIVVLGGLLLLFVCMLSRPRSAFVLGFLDVITCEDGPSERGDRVRIVCTRRAFEGSEFDTVMTFESTPSLPIMWLISAEW